MAAVTEYVPKSDSAMGCSGVASESQAARYDSMTRLKAKDDFVWGAAALLQRSHTPTFQSRHSDFLVRVTNYQTVIHFFS